MNRKFNFTFEFLTLKISAVVEMVNVSAENERVKLTLENPNGQTVLPLGKTESGG